MERARQKLEKLKERVASGDLKRPEKIGAAVERIMQKYHGYRYFEWTLNRDFPSVIDGTLGGPDAIFKLMEFSRMLRSVWAPNRREAVM